MKPFFKICASFSITLVMLLTVGCNDLLEEQPRSVLVPAYFKTSAGINGGLTAAYSYFRFYYGTEGGMNLNVYGTDEFTHGQQVTNPPLNVYTGLSAANGDIQTPWNRAYPAINTCNGVIELGPEATDLTDAQKTLLIAEAKYLRAHWYFILVQTFGAVSLDLGSGPLKFNQNPSNEFTRASTAEVYNAIIADLTAAAAELPDKPAIQGRAFKGSALHLLAKAYLTRGWSTDAQSSDFQNAYNTAKQLIDNAATYGVSLRPDYANVHQEGQEYNSEVLFAVGWVDNTTFNNNNGFLGGEESLRQNRSNFLFRMFYHSNMPGLGRDYLNGRPFVRYKPTPWVLDGAFADKINDSRYNKSFQTVWFVNNLTTANSATAQAASIVPPNWTAADVAAGAKNQNGTAAVDGQRKLNLGDTAIWTVPAHLAAAVEPIIAKKSFVVFTPTKATDPKAYFNNPNNTFGNFTGVNLQNQYYPTLRKYNATQPRPGTPPDPNISSVRPFIVHRFAETYLVAAEALFKLGNNTEAANMINVIRTRAATNAGAVAAMTANTLADLNAGGIDYILDERTRELCGEQMRWFDLVRTGKLIDRVKLYNTQAAANIQSFHVLRPIPQNQIDGAVDPTSSNGKYAQNPGY